MAIAAVLVVTGLLALVIYGAGCCRAKPATPVTMVHRGCLADANLGAAPKPSAEAADLSGPEGGCPLTFEFCATAKTAAALETWIRHSLRWMAEAEAACSQPEEN